MGLGASNLCPSSRHVICPTLRLNAAVAQNKNVSPVSLHGDSVETLHAMCISSVSSSTELGKPRLDVSLR